ncbi:hypothetical protein SAMN05421854_112118 [Amycolatopsis rubida]|uniref:Uncharacterized protein n=1 Tax=Amycolatopsis rubida TaxID=112413 RepID=A0A1I5YIM1_9PSEU|nr:hypothetical protein SAMN05421854_112118 [Amycolatopsis rubida]
MEQRRSLVSATVLIDARYLPVLRSRFGRHREVRAGLARIGRELSRLPAR